MPLSALIAAVPASTRYPTDRRPEVPVPLGMFSECLVSCPLNIVCVRQKSDAHDVYEQ
eukprot:SAG11_NODE_22234_length_409_cov_4.093548_2_plen_57_part_01